MPAKGSNRATGRVWQAAPLPFALDLDGVIWLADEPIAGAAEAVARLRGAGEDVVFVTNNSSQPVGEVEAKLARHGIPAEGDVITSAMAAAALVEPGERVLVCAGPGVVEALERAGRRAGARRRRRRGAGGVPPRLRLRAAADRGARRAPRRPPARDQRRLVVPDARGADPGRRRDPGRGRRPRRAPSAVVAGKPNRPMADLVRRAAGRPRGDGRRPARHRRALRAGARATGSRWCTPASRPPGCPSTRSPTSWRPTSHAGRPTSCANSCKHLRPLVGSPDGSERRAEALHRRRPRLHGAHPGPGGGAGEGPGEGRRGAGRPGPRHRGRPAGAEPQEQREAARDRPHRGAPADHQPRARHPGRPRPHRAADRVGDRHRAHRPRPAEEGGRQEGAGEEGGGQEGPGQEGAGRRRRRPRRRDRQEGPGQEARRPRSPRRRPDRWRGAASTPSWCGGAWRPAASRRRPTSRPGASPSAERPPTRPPGSSRPASRSACSARARGSWVGAARSSTPRSTRFAVAVDGRRAHDLGASTGGFTDCLLQRGAVVGGGGRRRLRPAARAAARRPAGGGARADQRPRPGAGRRGGARPSWWSPTCRSSPSARCSRRCSRSRPPAPTWCSS